MKCNRCGAEIPDGSRFCENCGAPQNSPAQNTQTAQTTSTAAKPKKTNWFVTILIVALVYFGARYAGQMFGSSMAGHSTDTGSASTQQSQSAGKSSGSSTSTVPSIAPIVDLITKHDVVSKDLGGGATNYLAVYYGNDTQLMTKLLAIYRLDTNQGYARGDVDNADFRSGFPSFAQFSYYEENGYVLCVVRMDELTDKRHMKEMVDTDIISVGQGTSIENSEGFQADYFLQSCRDSGYADVPLIDYGSLHLD